MSEAIAGPGGYVAYASAALAPDQHGTDHQGSFVVGSRYENMQQGSKRNVTQSAVMGISPNVAAQKLRLGQGAWEWLHMVAFSIRQTHISSMSAASLAMFTRTGQPQQISENLVLGSAGANTAMLTYETLIKNVMREQPGWRLNLSVQADVKRPTVGGVTIPVAQSIAFDFFFITADDKVTPPVVLRFNSLSLSAPSQQEYANVVQGLKAFIAEQQVARPSGLMGISTHGTRAFGNMDAAMHIDGET